MKCPECGGKIKATDYDSSFEWYECPTCEACVTADEILEAEVSKKSREVAAPGTKKRATKITGKREYDEKKVKKAVVAKGKKRREQIDADAEAIAEYEKKQSEVIVVDDKTTKHRDEISTGQIVQIMGDEIEVIYEEDGAVIDHLNAADKALTLWRHIHLHDGIAAREKTVEHVLCKDHS